jgi:hypothetical protein
MRPFVKTDSIVRKIWGNTDVILFIFAGAAAEFSVNKAVDWLYFTGKLPKDPLGRLFSTVTYAQQIVFSTEERAFAAIDQITAIHAHVETARGSKIPDWAYRDVLFMLIYYAIRAYEVLERELTITEKEEVFTVFNRVGQRMDIVGLPTSYQEWEEMHQKQLQHDIAYSNFSKDLFNQYQKQLGSVRYLLLKKVQALIVPTEVNKLLDLGESSILRPILSLYKGSRLFNLQNQLRSAILPSFYRNQIMQLGRQL